MDLLNPEHYNILWLYIPYQDKNPEDNKKGELLRAAGDRTNYFYILKKDTTILDAKNGV